MNEIMTSNYGFDFEGGEGLRYGGAYFFPLLVTQEEGHLAHREESVIVRILFAYRE